MKQSVYELTFENVKCGVYFSFLDEEANRIIRYANSKGVGVTGFEVIEAENKTDYLVIQTNRILDLSNLKGPHTRIRAICEEVTEDEAEEAIIENENERRTIMISKFQRKYLEKKQYKCFTMEPVDLSDWNEYARLEGIM